jgi:uncharacterized protein YyaL (SSP411 family)
MADRLRDAVSPYLRSHAENPVDWYPWGDAAFAEAARRNVPLLVSIGYSTCHWCHVMARESFSDPALAGHLNANFVAVKVDREEHPDVDASYLTAAGAFTEHLGWPLNVFVTPQGKPFYAGTYWPPAAAGGQPSFRQVLDAVRDAWANRRDEVEHTAAAVSEALHAAPDRIVGALPGTEQFDTAVRELAGFEDTRFGGFGGAPKFPVAPVVLFLLERAAAGDAAALGLAGRTLRAIAGVGRPADAAGGANPAGGGAAGEAEGGGAAADAAEGANPAGGGAGGSHTVAALRDRIDGGFFRYATARDWSAPHYERMLYDNAQLLAGYTRLAQLDADGRDDWARIAEGIAGFLLEVMERPGGGFASAQDSESTVDGVRVEGGYYELDAAARRRQAPPAVDGKVLTGWNGLAIGALATAGFVLGRQSWIDAARRAADVVITRHLSPDGSMLRASIDGRASAARATLEDFGMLTGGLLELAVATGEAPYAVVARALVDRSIAAGGSAPFGVPGGADPVLVAQGTALEIDPSEGAYPSGLSAMARASYSLYLLTGFDRYREATTRVIELLTPLAVPRPISFGSLLAVASAVTQPITQLVVVTHDAHSPLAAAAREQFRSGGVVSILTREQAASFAEAGFGLFAGRQREAAYLCQHFVCRLPLTDPDELRRAIG